VDDRGAADLPKEWLSESRSTSRGAHSRRAPSRRNGVSADVDSPCPRRGLQVTAVLATPNSRCHDVPASPAPLAPAVCRRRLSTPRPCFPARHGSMSTQPRTGRPDRSGARARHAPIRRARLGLAVAGARVATVTGATARIGRGRRVRRRPRDPRHDWRDRRLAPEVWLLCEQDLGANTRTNISLSICRPPRR